MWHNKNLLLIFGVLCIRSFAQSLDNRSFKKEWKYQGNKVFKYGRDIATADNSFLYAVCTEEKLPTEMNCNVTIETPILPWDNNGSLTETCQLNLTGSKDSDLKHEVTGIVSVERLAKDRVIVVWWERQHNSQYQIQNIKVSIVRMANCTSSNLTFPVDAAGRVLLSNVVVYPEGFDAIVSHKATCGTSTCRISHDLEGNRVGDPVPFVTNFDAVRTELVASASPAKGFYLSGADINAWTFRAVHVTASGVGTDLVIARVPDPRHIQRATSNAHELFGICLMVDGKIRCAQFDAKAHTKLDATLNVSGTVHWMAVHNLSEGGLVLLTGHCKNHKCRSFRLTRIRGNGRRKGKPTDVQDLDLKCSRVPRDLVVDIAESRTEFCFYFACAYGRKTQEEDAKSIITFSTKCVSKFIIQHE